MLSYYTSLFYFSEGSLSKIIPYVYLYLTFTIVEGLTYDKLIYFVRAGYIRLKKIKKQSLYYNDFPKEDVELIKRAWEFISKHDLKPSARFERASKKIR